MVLVSETDEKGGKPVYIDYRENQQETTSRRNMGLQLPG